MANKGLSIETILGLQDDEIKQLVAVLKALDSTAGGAMLTAATNLYAQNQAATNQPPYPDPPKASKTKAAQW